MNQKLFSEQYLKHILDSDKQGVFELVKQELDDGVPVEDLYKGIEEAMYEIGRMWHKNEISIAHEHLATAITQWVLMAAFPQFGHNTPERGKKVVSFTVAGNNHDLGIKMVNDILESKGFPVIYLGTNLPVTGALEFINREAPDYILVSVALPVNVPYAKEAISTLKQSEELKETKIIAGGYCFKQFPALLEKLDYDYYASDLKDFIELSETL
ncbi:cobalamin B12-binding domain-containing protein [Salimicrobium flavidum]|uniref:Methanogenic corrinoid protein MtbC1 n=1 Tax=Salimicrobium flavidum TaxID=570947 RepID=A0A1N7JCG8_9BACI|nr:cobalamin-dependent protein [Salimicrobium flavidum]SIS47028.1 Methanogenic corrinoid protein MtbC1 [Salimicrobium flavidum]